VFFPEPGAVAVVRRGSCVLLGAPGRIHQAERMIEVLSRLGVERVEYVAVEDMPDDPYPAQMFCTRFGCEVLTLPDPWAAGTGKNTLDAAENQSFFILGIPANRSADGVTLSFADALVLKTRGDCAIITQRASPLLSFGDDVVRYRLRLGERYDT
jgi:hypothetical protein